MKRKWPEQHARRCEKLGLNWWERSCPSDEAFDLFPGLRALSSRQLDILSFSQTKFPDEKGTQEVVHSGARSTVKPGMASCVLPGGQLYLRHRCRLALGVESLSLQGINFGPERQTRVEGYPSKHLQDLAGNAFHVWCSGARSLTSWVVRALACDSASKRRAVQQTIAPALSLTAAP